MRVRCIALGYSNEKRASRPPKQSQCLATPAGSLLLPWVLAGGAAREEEEAFWWPGDSLEEAWELAVRLWMRCSLGFQGRDADRLFLFFFFFFSTLVVQPMPIMIYVATLQKLRHPVAIVIFCFGKEGRWSLVAGDQIGVRRR